MAFYFRIKGAARGKFVPSISGRNTVYGPDVDVAQMSKEQKLTYQAAMRQRRRQQVLVDQKKDNCNKR